MRRRTGDGRPEPSAAANSSSSQHASVSRAKDTINVFRGRRSRRQRVLSQHGPMALPTLEEMIPHVTVCICKEHIHAYRVYSLFIE